MSFRIFFWHGAERSLVDTIDALEHSVLVQDFDPSVRHQTPCYEWHGTIQQFHDAYEGVYSVLQRNDEDEGLICVTAHSNFNQR